MSDFELPAQGVKKPVTRPAIKPSESGSKATTYQHPIMGEANIPDAEDKKASEPEKKPEPKYPEEELLRVFDEIIFSGEYREDYWIRNKVKVAFKTRTAEEVNSIQAKIDSAQYNLISSVETAKSLFNLQYSLAFYKDKELSLMKPEERLKFVEQLPGPVVGMLIELLSRFDEKVALALKEGEANF